MNLTKKREINLFRRALAVLLTTLLTLNPISPIFTPKEVTATELVLSPSFQYFAPQDKWRKIGTSSDYDIKIKLGKVPSKIDDATTQPNELGLSAGAPITWWVIKNNSTAYSNLTCLYSEKALCKAQYDSTGNNTTKAYSKSWGCSYVISSAPTEVNINHYGGSKIRNKILKTLNSNRNVFAESEDNLLCSSSLDCYDNKNSKIGNNVYYTLKDKIYLPSAGSDKSPMVQGGTSIFVPTSNFGTVPYRKWPSNCDECWLRSPFNVGYSETVLTASSSAKKVGISAAVNKGTTLGVAPACTINTASLLFSSAAPSASTLANSGIKILPSDDIPAQNLRLKDDTILGTLGRTADYSKIEVKGAVPGTYLVVQGVHGSYNVAYAKQVSDDGTAMMEASDAHLSTLNGAKVWLEKESNADDDGQLLYANAMASVSDVEVVSPLPSITSITTTYKSGLTLNDVPFPESADGDTEGEWEWIDDPNTPINAGTYNFKAKFTPKSTLLYDSVETYIKVIVEKAALSADNFTFTPPDDGNAIYTGYGKSASVTPNGIKGVGDITVYYQTKETSGDEVVLGEPTTTPPTDVGTYVVSIDVTEDTNYNQAEKLSLEDWTFEIMPATPKDPGTPTAIPIIYGYKLSTSTLTVPGWKWVEPDIIPTVTNTGYVAYYSIEGTVGKYDWDTVAKEGGYKINNATTGGLPARLEKTIPLTVSPATPSCEKPTDLKATYGQTLANIALTTGWSWVNPDESVGEAGSHRFEAIFTQFKEGSNTEADDNYKTVNEMLDVEVKKADPKYLLPESITATYGQKLSELELPKQTEGEDFTPGYFKWVSEDAYVGDATTDGREFDVKFVPYDTKNYEESQQETLKVIVNPKSITGDDITISGIAEKYEYNGEDSIQPEVTVTDNGTTLTKDEDYTVSYSSSSDSWEVVGGKIYGKVEISGKENYTGTVTKKFEILDKVLPTGSIYLDENDDVIFSEFNSNIKFGYMFNENKHVKIEGSDSETGIKSIHYYISDEDLFNEKETYTDDEIESTISSKGWKEYNKSESIELKKGTKSIIYAKIADNSGNVKYISSQGIIVYDKVDANLSETYTKSSENDIEIISDLKGNTLKEVKLGSDTLKDTNYVINENKVSLNGSYLESLPAGDYTFTVSYNPMGEEFIQDSTKGNKPEDIDIVVKVQRATLSEDDFNYESPIDLIYNEKAKEAKVTVKEGITGVGEITVKYYDSKGALLENPPTDVGEYTVKIDVAPSDKYNKIEDITSDDWKFTVSYLSIEEAQPYEITGHVFVNGNNYWLKDEAHATIKPAQNLSGYMISTDLKGPYNSKLEISSWESGTSIYLKDSRGHMTGEIPVNVNITQDKKSPEGSITLENLSTWKDFVNLITFGLFFKNEQTATITATDNESGIKEAKYLVSNSDLIQKENATAEEIVTILDGQTGWVTFAGSSKDVVLEKDNKYVVYEKITDNVGHVTYVSSDGIVIYTDSKTDVDEIEYVKETQNNLKLKIYTNGNTVKGIEIKDAEDIKYTVGYTISQENKNESTITFNWEDLNKLKYGNYTLTITYNPLGFEYKNNGDSPNDSVVTLSVVKNPKVTVDKFNYESPASLIYDGKPKEAKVTVKEGITGVGKITVKYYDSIGTLLENPPTDVGEYTVKIDVDEGDSYGKASNLTGEGWGFTIKQALPENPVTPTLESVKYGTKLSEITLDEGWNWVDDTIISTIENQGYAAYYDVEDDTNYDWSEIDGYNPELHRVERTLNLTVFVDKSGWGEEVKNNGEINYVDKDGTTSAEIVKKDITWLKEESEGTSAWYGIDNSDGTFELGSRFWVRWLSEEKDSEEWEYYYNNLDENHKNAVDSGRLWIFLVGITGPNGQEYKEFNTKEVPFYIQLGEDWDKDDINAVFISREADEVIDVEYVDDMEYPDGSGEFAKLTLKHFSPYAVYDYLENQESMPDVIENNANFEDEDNIEDNDLPVLFRWLVTGDTNTLIILTGLAVLVISSGILIVFLKKKRKN